MDAMKAILERRSIRRFTSDAVSGDDLDKILEAGRWAPSGLNNQPWRFSVITDSGLKAKLADLTCYGRIILDAPVNLAVFLDSSASYDRLKDLLAMGACIQNMLLAAYSLGLGAVWLGEILKNRKKVEELLSAPAGCELVALISLGHPGEKGSSDRKPLDELLF